MVVLKRGVNLFLVILIVLSVTTIAGLTLYYQDSFRVTASDLVRTQENLSVCLTSLGQTQQELDTTKIAVSANREDVDKTVSLFEQRTNELQQTQGQLASANANNTRLEGIIKQRDFTIGVLNNNITQLNKQITTLNRQILELEDRIDDLRDDLEACYEG